MKCDIVSSKPEGFDVDIFEEAIAEVYAFRALVKANKELEGNYAIGRQNVMDPLHQFGFDKKDNGNKYFCHLYSYINGEPLEEYFRRHTISQAFIITSKILPDIIRGLIYLYNAGIIHYDLHPRNIMLQQDPTGRIVGVKIIGLDAADYTIYNDYTE
ncbi:hypothetical protein BDF22DRAFT_735446 [Syncephalis plumigaleata]|nr:hypothetical protein BDF22DRAFT_735446 [Syncephalis plumigaleata]